jgi:methenyltetrahydromethanopterin cyclohydrolase
MDIPLNRRADDLLSAFKAQVDHLHVTPHVLGDGGTVWDCGVEARGGLSAGFLMARACMADLGYASISQGSLAGWRWPCVTVSTDSPLEACLLSQYAGWKVAVGDFFGMGSGPIRAAAATEALFEEFGYHETCDRLVGVLETESLPGADVFAYLAQKTGVPAEHITLLVAPTASQAGNVQIVARSVETALHKLHELGFDVRRVRSGVGTAPLPPVATDFLSALGRTNDAILYGGQVTLWVTGDDASLESIGPQVPSSASKSHGRPFREIFEAAGGDFYQIDPHLFSPAEVVLQNLDTGRVFRYGSTAEDVLADSFGLR